MSERRDKAKASVPRKRALVSCDRCKLRRARCIRNNPDEPCADCKMSGLHCESKLPRKQRVYGSVETLSLRYRALESLVKGLFPQENVQDTNAIFKLAAARNISMPTRDDYTTADIFNNNSQHALSAQEEQDQAFRHSTIQVEQPSHPSPQMTHQPVRSVATGSPTHASKDSPHNPFSEVQQPSQQFEELIPTRHGVPHYFGPSSSFRLATTIRMLVARCKSIQGADIPGFRRFDSTRSDSASRTPASLQRTSTNPSDEEYTVHNQHGPQLSNRGSKKRSRLDMEESDAQRERVDGSLNSGIVADLLPSRTLADALVSAYFDHVHIYLPLFHRSMFQFRLETTYSKQAEPFTECRDIGWLICLALVFSFGCQQLHGHDPEQAHTLQLKYLDFAKTHFRKLLMTTSLANVQALVLLNLHHHMVGQKSSSWLLIGLGARMAVTMGMHRDGPNMEFDPIERNTRRQVWWSIYTFEKILCSILGRPTVMDDNEMSMRIPDAPMLEQRSMSAEFMELALELHQLSYRLRQRAYFDARTAEERSPTLDVAITLLRECDVYFLKIPRHLSVEFSSPVPPDQRARILLLHVYYYYTRCIASRDFLIRKVERNIDYMENKLPSISQGWDTTLALSEDCVESAHQSIRCIMAGSEFGMIGVSWLDLFFVFHSVLIVCADFLARPREQQNSPKDVERKEMVRAMLDHVRGMKKLAPTYSILSRIAIQFASMTGVCDDPDMPEGVSGQAHDSAFESRKEDSTLSEPGGIFDAQEDWFANATADLGLDFFDLNQSAGTVPIPMQPADPGYFGPNTSEVGDWTDKALRGMHTI